MSMPSLFGSAFHPMPSARLSAISRRIRQNSLPLSGGACRAASRSPAIALRQWRASRRGTLLSGQRERDAVSAISAEIDRLAASIQPIVQPKRDRATGHDADIHPVTVSNLVDFLSWFQCLKGGVRQYPLPPEKYRQYGFEAPRQELPFSFNALRYKKVPSRASFAPTVLRKIRVGKYAEGPSSGPSKPISAYRSSLIVPGRIYFCFQYVTSHIGVFPAAFEWV